MGSYGKWVGRKAFDGRWLVYRPAEFRPIAEFSTGAEMLAWKPDCERFLRRYCHCRFECAR